MKPIVGTTSFYFETGTEGGYWAIHEDGKEGYDALHILEDGDRLTIWNVKPYSKERGETLWSGEIKLTRYPSFTQDACGYWIHADQEGVGRAFWARWFFDKLPAELIKAEGFEEISE